MYIINVEVKGFSYYVRQEYNGHYTLQGLKDNATSYSTKEAAKRAASYMNIAFDSITTK
jgi:hypothetical protein